MMFEYKTISDNHLSNPNLGHEITSSLQIFVGYFNLKNDF